MAQPITSQPYHNNLTIPLTGSGQYNRISDERTTENDCCGCSPFFCCYRRRNCCDTDNRYDPYSDTVGYVCDDGFNTSSDIGFNRDTDVGFEANVIGGELTSGCDPSVDDGLNPCVEMNNDVFNDDKRDEECKIDTPWNTDACNTQDNNDFGYSNDVCTSNDFDTSTNDFSCDSYGGGTNDD